ncbi:verrucotoxin subunit beta-like [Daphnia pulex]|uniref:verrucotoxin subunit beta-like n=1 Tax=Daphnia pulex TaxID=6669 RepID=UPI001EDD87D3|nr:verrucotoxin subunit beta-like [Daphnia pulex]
MSTDISRRILQVHAFGRNNLKLGTLYDARTDEVVPTEFSLWKQNDLKTTDVTHNTQTHCTVIASDKLSEKLKRLEVEGSLQISILSGLTDLKGPAHFLKKKQKTLPESIVHVRCHHYTVVKSLTTEQLSKGKARYVDISTRTGYSDSATHVITKIQYGSESTFTFRKLIYPAQVKQIVDDHLAECASNVVNALLGKALLEDPNINSSEIIECHFEGDFMLPENFATPTTYRETLVFASQFREILSLSMAKSVENEPLGIPCLVSLFPLVNLSGVESVPRLRQEISNTVASRCVRLMEDYDDMEDEIETLLQNPLAAELSPLFEKLRVFQQLFDAFRADLKAKLRDMLIDIRSGFDDVASLGQLLNRFYNQQFPFNPRRLGLWLKEKHEELCMVKRFRDQLSAEKLHRERILIFPSEALLREQMATCTVRETFHFVFTSLARPDTLLAHLENPTFDADEIDDESDSSRWYRDHQVVEQMEHEALNFTAFIKSKMEDKSVAFALTASDVNDETCTTGSSIFAYRRGILIQKNAVRILSSRMKMQVFANRIAKVLKAAVTEAFIQEMIEKTCNEIKHKRWLHDAKFMHNYMDCHLAEWLKSAEGDQEIIPKIVHLIGCPKEFYNKVLEKLIAQTVTNVDEAWNAFVNTLKRAIQKAALATDPSADVRVTRAQRFVYQLRIKFSQCGLSNSAILDSAFQIDCSGEYDDLNSKGDVSFKEIWSCELIKVLDKQRRPINLDLESSLENNERECCTTRVVDYTKFSRKVIEYMKSSPFSKFGESARPRCDACCPICKALCSVHRGDQS